MDLKKYCLQSLTDPTWIDKTIAEMGELKFWIFAKKVYDLLDTLKVGESMKIPTVNESNTEFYIKISCYYVSESNCCYQFNRSYTEVKRQFDNDKITASIKLLKQNKITYETLVQTSN